MHTAVKLSPTALNWRKYPSEIIARCFFQQTERIGIRGATLHTDMFPASSATCGDTVTCPASSHRVHTANLHPSTVKSPSLPLVAMSSRGEINEMCLFDWRLTSYWILVDFLLHLPATLSHSLRVVTQSFTFS
uniref:Uncharacterized protein n=1 Tax=Guillardia theta TaxID=55529 RepID=A0A7S4HBD7_GUITH